LAPPPRDTDGNVLPHDAADITSDDGLIRRISDRQIVTDAKGERRISSLAFKPSSRGRYPGMSIDLERQIREDGIDPQKFVTTPVWTGSVHLVTGDVRNEGLQVGSHPVPENSYHGEIWGIQSKAQQHKLQSMASWFVPIPGVLLN
jgi:hypothetical protein